MLATKKRIVIATRFVGGFRLCLGYALAAAVFVDRNEDKVRAGDVEVRSGLRILYPDFHTDLKGRVEGAIDAGLEDEQIADVHGLNEIDVIHRSRDDVGARVAIGGDGAGEIDEVHQATAEEVAERVGVVGEDNLSHFGLGAGHRADKRVGFSRAHGFTCSNFRLQGLQGEFTSGYNGNTSVLLRRSTRFQFRQSTPITQIALVQKSPIMSTTDKIAGLKEILALDPKNAFARYGIAMELANRGEVDAALKEFDVLIEQNPDYTAAYFMSAQTLAKAGRNADAVEKLKAGIACAARTGNRHALSEMQGMLDELDR